MRECLHSLSESLFSRFVFTLVIPGGWVDTDSNTGRRFDVFIGRLNLFALLAAFKITGQDVTHSLSIY